MESNYKTHLNSSIRNTYNLVGIFLSALITFVCVCVCVCILNVRCRLPNVPWIVSR